jgi:hypothetical protein
VRVRGEPSSIMSSVRSQIRAADASVPVFEVQTMEEARRESFWQFGLFGSMFSTFGGIALLLAAIGIYGVISFGVAQRTQEIGVRVALGAQHRHVLGMVVGHGVRLTAIGVPWRDVARGEVRELEWDGEGGRKMQGFLALPPIGRGATQPLPLVTIVHGGPTGAVRFDYQLGRWARVLADVGFAVFVPNYRGSTGWGLDFAESNVGDMGGADFADIMAGIDRLLADGTGDVHQGRARQPALCSGRLPGVSWTACDEWLVARSR